MQTMNKINSTISIGLMLISLLFGLKSTHAQTAANTHPLPIAGEILNIDLNDFYGRELILYKEISNFDTRPIAVVIESSQGLVASLQVTANSKSKSRRKLINRYGRTWGVSFLNENNKVISDIKFTDEGITTKSGLGFIQADACNRLVNYTLELKLDLSHYARSSIPEENIIRLSSVLGIVPEHQQTLFKYPSEKSAALAVLLMKTSFGSSQIINVVDWSKGYPRNLKSYKVDKYYYSSKGIFTRLYIPTSSLSGAQVTLEHLTLGYSYGVCAKLARKRQQLEGYTR